MIYRITPKGKSANPRGEHNVRSWGKIKAFIEMGGGEEITENQFLFVAAEHDHPDGPEGYLYHVVNRNQWLEPI
ncbi:hypothetical protein [Haliea sp. E17]|uniref:hypothetical protein n=1 Tax=Haliea sp. E17 TaxID=3401576 RepID=UPI003AAA3808